MLASDPPNFGRNEYFAITGREIGKAPHAMARDPSTDEEETARWLPARKCVFPDVLAERARRQPSEELLRTVRFERGVPRFEGHTTQSLMLGAERAAGALQRLGIQAGDRVLIALDSPADFLRFFVGVQGIGAIPVPAPSLGAIPLAAYRERLRSIFADARPAALVLAEADATMTAEAVGPATPVCTPALLSSAWAGEPGSFRTDRDPGAVAFLQYTSGSTGEPKGVVVLHRNLTENIRSIAEAGRMGPRDVVFSWLPLFHDMGLVAGLALGLYLGVPTYVASPKTFASRPDSWLRAISGFRATFSPGPNFAYDVLAHRLPERALEGVDLSSWRLAFNGAELVDPRTVADFVSRFRPRGLADGCVRPAYGLAEATLAVAFPREAAPLRVDRVDRAALTRDGVAAPADGDAGATVQYASVGRAMPGHTVRVIDPVSGLSLPERRVGEIVVAGPSVTPGYFDELASGGPARAELRTGDLGYVADGDLFVVDRLKDILVVGGRKLAPTDVERTVAGLPGVRPGAVIAFSMRGDRGTDELCVAVGVEPGAGDGASLLQDVRRTTFDHFGLTPLHVALVRPSALPRTSSGKLRRAECRARFEAGGLQPAPMGGRGGDASGDK